MTKLKCQIKPKTQKFKVLSVMGLLKNSDVYYLYPTCSLVQHAAARRALEKLKAGEKEKYFISFNQLYFLKSYKQVGEVNLEVSLPPKS